MKFREDEIQVLTLELLLPTELSPHSWEQQAFNVPWDLTQLLSPNASNCPSV